MRFVTAASAAILAATFGSSALAQAPASARSSACCSARRCAARPHSRVATTKVEGTENVYIFRNGNHQAMFIVTKDGVIATDPVAYGRPDGGKQYVEEIRKVTQAPIKYVVYSHHHLDHIAGGKAFKDAGAKFVAHQNATKRLEGAQRPAHRDPG